MALLELILLSVLHLEAVDSGERFYYYRPGHEAFLPCSTVSPPLTSCSNIHWLYCKNIFQTIFEAENGNVLRDSVRSDRLSLTTNCSLLIHDIRAEDVGLYTCRMGKGQDFAHIYLNVLKISSSAADADPSNGGVTLTCSLERYEGLGPCGQNSLRWLNETGAVLLAEGVEHKSTNCVSVLSVKHQSSNNRRFICQFVDEEKKVKIEADYTLKLSGSSSSSSSSRWFPMSCFMWMLRVSALVLMMVNTVLLLRLTGSDRIKQVRTDGDDGGAASYENVDNRSAVRTLR